MEGEVENFGFELIVTMQRSSSNLTHLIWLTT